MGKSEQEQFLEEQQARDRQPPPRMTSAGQQSIPVTATEVPEVQRFLEQMRAQRSMEAGGGKQDIAGITHEFMKRELGLILKRIEGLVLSDLNYRANVLAILDEHIQALE